MAHLTQLFPHGATDAAGASDANCVSVAQRRQVEACNRWLSFGRQLLHFMAVAFFGWLLLFSAAEVDSCAGVGWSGRVALLSTCRKDEKLQLAELKDRFEDEARAAAELRVAVSVRCTQTQTLRARQPLLGLEGSGLLHRLLRGQHKVSDQSSLDGLDFTSLGSVEVR